MGVSERFPAGQHSSLPHSSLKKISKMFKTALFLTLVATCLGDLPAPSGGYGAPTGGYDAPTGYDQQAGYGDYDQGGYELADEGGDDIGAKLGELIPLFLVVFAAIILAQLLSPLLLSLFGILIGIVPMALSINLILAPFNLQLCSVDAAGAVTAFPAKRSFSSRSLKDAVTAFGYDVSDAKIDILADFVNNAMESFSSSESA